MSDILKLAEAITTHAAAISELSKALSNLSLPTVTTGSDSAVVIKEAEETKKRTRKAAEKVEDAAQQVVNTPAVEAAVTHTASEEIDIATMAKEIKAHPMVANKAPTLQVWLTYAQPGATELKSLVPENVGKLYSAMKGYEGLKESMLEFIKGQEALVPGSGNAKALEAVHAVAPGAPNINSLSPDLYEKIKAQLGSAPVAATSSLF